VYAAIEIFACLFAHDLICRIVPYDVPQRKTEVIYETGEQGTCASGKHAIWNLLPAHIEKAAKVVSHVATEDAKENETVLESVLDGTQEILGVRGGGRMLAMAPSYNLDYVSTGMDITGLVQGLQQSGRGNICFYGPPGTGKTALAAHIAGQMDKTLIAKRTSDILSCWVGETEQNVAAMFKEAKREDVVLLLDAADSFLRDQRGSNHSWEVTQVNELLVQMENFDGLFICSTNLMDDLNQASLRSFAIKVEFDYLKQEQAWKMFKQECIGTLVLLDEGDELIDYRDAKHIMRYACR